MGCELSPKLICSIESEADVSISYRLEPYLFTRNSSTAFSRNDFKSKHANKYYDEYFDESFFAPMADSMFFLFLCAENVCILPVGILFSICFGSLLAERECSYRANCM